MTLTNTETLIDEFEEPIYTPLPGQRERHPLLDLPVAWRLMLGFLSAALIAVSVAGVIGVQYSTSFKSQAHFYKSLVGTNATLTNGTSLLQLMTSKTNEALAQVTNPTPSQEDLATTLDAIHRLIDRYDTAITSYATNELLSKYPDQVDLFSATGHVEEVRRQSTLATRALRTWETYRGIQEQVLQYLVSGNALTARYIQRFRAEPANGDALSAVNSLIQFNERMALIAEDVQDAEAQRILIITIVSAIVAFVLIISLGVLISLAQVVRFNRLLRVIEAAEQGDVSARVAVIGRDQIGRVSASMNTMLATIADLQEKVGQQQNALINAAQHLFNDIKLVSVNDLVSVPSNGSRKDIGSRHLPGGKGYTQNPHESSGNALGAQTTKCEDPIGMLASALNFTIGRLSRLAQCTQAAARQLDAISQRELDHARALIHAITEQKQTTEAGKFYPDLSSSKSKDTLFSQVKAPLQDQVSTIEHRDTQSSQEILYLTKQQVTSIQHMSTQFAQEIIYLANQLDNLAQELKQSLSLLEAKAQGQSVQGKAPYSAFDDLFSKLSQNMYSPASPYLPVLSPETRKE